jgi:tetratricopeptide (TPR) repeat protein
VAVRERLVKLGPDNPQYLRGLALSRGNLGLALANIGRDDEAVPVYEVAIADVSVLAERNPGVPEFRSLKANDLIDVTDVLTRLGRHEEALRSIGAAVLEYEALTRGTAASSDYRLGLGAARASLSAALDTFQRYAEAESQARRACEELEALVKQARAVPLYSRYLGVAHMTRGTILHHLGRDREAEPVLHRAIEILQSVAGSRPDLASIQDDIGQAYESLAGFYRDRGQAEPFLRAVDEAIARRRAALKRAPGQRQPRAALAQLHRQRGEALLMMGRPDEAVVEADQLVDLEPGTAGDLVAAARLLAQAAGAAQGNRAETYSSQSLERLRSAQRTGPVDFAKLADDRGFAALRSHPDFRLLLMDLAMPADPFAH